MQDWPSHVISLFQHIIADVEQITTCTLETLSALPHFNYLTLNVTNKRLGSSYQPIDWESLDNFFQDSQLRVGVNIVSTYSLHSGRPRI